MTGTAKSLSTQAGLSAVDMAAACLCLADSISDVDADLRRAAVSARSGRPERPRARRRSGDATSGPGADTARAGRYTRSKPARTPRGRHGAHDHA